MKTSVLKRILWSLVGALLCACGDDAGQGKASFTTWGEEYIEQGIPADPAGDVGFVDGWSVKFDKFLVVFSAIKVEDADHKLGGLMAGSKLVDNTKPNRKPLVSFDGIDAQHWDNVSYEISPAQADTEIVAGTAADLQLMVENGYSIYVAGVATKQAGGQTVTKTFKWGFRTSTRYRNCQQAEESGQALQGIVVTNGGDDTSELTTHGDHFFYDRLMASDDPAVKTSLRFEEKAAADSDNNGEVTLEELNATRIDVRLYDPSGFNAPTLGAFVTALARTVGHFRGEGECTVLAL